MRLQSPSEKTQTLLAEQSWSAATEIHRIHRKGQDLSGDAPLGIKPVQFFDFKLESSRVLIEDVAPFHA